MSWRAHRLTMSCSNGGAVGEGWRRRWDSFCLVIPNWTVQLPGCSYRGDDPDGFMARDEIVEFLDGYTRSFSAPVRAGVEVSAVTPHTGGGFTVRASTGDIHAQDVVLASGDTSARIDRRLRSSCLRGRSWWWMQRVTRTPVLCLQATSWWWAAARPAASWRRSASKPAAGCRLPAVALRGCLAESRVATP